MAERMTGTLPAERKRIGDCDREGHLKIASIDRERHTVDLAVDGCPVTLICSPQSSPKTYQRIKSVLLDMVVGNIAHS